MVDKKTKEVTPEELQQLLGKRTPSVLGSMTAIIVYIAFFGLVLLGVASAYKWLIGYLF